jgi:hypothetical protein
MKLRLLVAVGLMLNGLAANAQDVGLGMEVKTHVAAVPGEDIAQHVVFTDERLRVTLNLFMMRSRANAGGIPLLVPGEWPQTVTWKLEDERSGQVIPLREVTLIRAWKESEDRSRDTNILRANDIIHAVFDVPTLLAGNYLLKAELSIPAVGDQPAWDVGAYPRSIRVRTGEESEALQREHLEAMADHILSSQAPDRFERFRSVMLRLAKLEPSNPMIYERLGDIAAPIRPPVETLAYYERALQLTQAAVFERYGTKVAADAQHAMAARQRSLTVFARAQEAYQKAGTGARLAVFNDASGKRIVIYRADETVASEVR